MTKKTCSCLKAFYGESFKVECSFTTRKDLSDNLKSKTKDKRRIKLTSQVSKLGTSKRQKVKDYYSKSVNLHIYTSIYDNFLSKIDKTFKQKSLKVRTLCTQNEPLVGC